MRTYRGHFNVKNGGVIGKMPEDCIIESPGFVDRFGINMVEGVTPPDARAATCMALVNVQRMGKWAAMTGDVELLKQSGLYDPLVGAICTPQVVWQMVAEMLMAQEKSVPQYARAIPDARKRLEYRCVKTRDWAGAARLRVRSVDELRQAQAKRRQPRVRGRAPRLWAD